MNDIYEPLTQLGGSSELPESPDKAVIECVDNPHPNVDYNVRFTCPEFTSLCPKTGQPDFAHIVIDYIPNRKLVESKSLKLYLHSFRNHGGFHEECTIDIAKKLIDAVDPIWLRIGGYWYPRGGIPIDIFYQNSDKPKHIWVPDLDVPGYKGRG